MGCCDGSLTALFRTSFDQILDKDSDSASILMQSHLFSELTQGEKHLTADRAEQSQFLEKNHVIMKKGDRTRKLFVITAGSVNVCHEDKVLHTKERGDVLDVYSLIQGTEHSFDFKVGLKDTMGYWLDLGLLKLLKDENVDFWDTLWKAAAADVIRYSLPTARRCAEWTPPIWTTWC